MEEYSVFGSEEEVDDPRDADTDEDLTEEEKDIQEVVLKEYILFIILSSSFFLTVYVDDVDH